MSASIRNFADSEFIKDIVNSESKTGKFIFIMLLLVGCIVLIRAFMTFMPMLLSTQSPYLVKGLIPGNTSFIIHQDPNLSDSIAVSRSDNKSGLECSWSVWLNLSDVSSSSQQVKHIFHKGEQHIDTDTGMNFPNNGPGLYISPNNNELIVIMNTFTVINEEIRIPNIPMNKWMSVVIRVMNNTVDVYINGALAKRHVLSSVPKQNNGDVYVASNGGFSGNLSDLRYYNYALQPGQILSITDKGPNLTVNKKTSLNASPPYLSVQWYTNNS
jgi:hypothetical protein